MNKVYCGFKNKPPGKRPFGARRACKEKGQLRRFGRIAVVAPNNHVPGNHHSGTSNNH